MSEVYVETLADIQNLSNDLVRELEHLLAQTCVSCLLTVATNQKRCKLEAHTDGPGTIVTIVFTGIQKTEVGNVVGFRELLGLGQLGGAIVAC